MMRKLSYLLLMLAASSKYETDAAISPLLTIASPMAALALAFIMLSLVE